MANCGTEADCDALTQGTVVTVTAVPANGYDFVRWQCSGSCPAVINPAASVTLTIERDTRITPVFLTQSPLTFNIAIPADIAGNNVWDWLENEATTYNFAAFLNRYPTLMRLSERHNNWIPAIADGFPDQAVTDGDGYSITARIRDGLTWSDGSPLNAHDIAFTLNTVVRLELTPLYRPHLGSSLLESVEVIDDLTVKYHFTSNPGLAFWQYGVSQSVIVPDEYWAPRIEELIANYDDPATKEIEQEVLDQLFAIPAWDEPSGGPQTILSVENDRVRLGRNDRYYLADSTVRQYSDGTHQETIGGQTINYYGNASGTVELEFIRDQQPDLTVFTSYPSAAAAVDALIAGIVDYYLSPVGLSSTQRARLEGVEGVSTFQNPPNGFRYLGFNTRREPFGDVAFRQAVATLIDLEYIANDVLQGAVLPIYSVVPEGNEFWHNPDVPRYGFNMVNGEHVPMTRAERISETVRILTEANYSWSTEPSWDSVNQMVVAGEGFSDPDGQEIEEFEIISVTQAYDPLRFSAATFVQRWLNEAGIPAVVVPTDFNEIVQSVFTDQDFDIWVLGWGLTPYPDHLVLFYTRDNAGPDGFNPGGWVNDRYEALAVELLTTTDINAARNLAFQMQEIIARDLPAITLFSTPLVEAYRSDRIAFAYTDVLDGVQSQFLLTDGPLSSINFQLDTATANLTVGSAIGGSVSISIIDQATRAISSVTNIRLAIGATLSVTAIPNQGYRFARWECSGSCPSDTTAATVSLTITNRVTRITPVFTKSTVDVIHATFDLSPQIAENVRNGVTLFGTNQQQPLQGYFSILTLALWERVGITPPYRITNTGPVLVTSDIVDSAPTRFVNEDLKDNPSQLNYTAILHAECAYDAFWCTVQAGIELAAEDAGVNVQILAPSAGGTIEEMAQLIDATVANRPDGILVTYPNEGLKASIQRAVDSGIPVIIINSSVTGKPSTDRIDYLTFLGQDEYQGGYQAGQRLAEAAGSGNHKGVCITPITGSSSLDARCRGFIDALSEASIPIADDQPARAGVLNVGFSPTEAEKTITDFYTANPDVDIFLTLGPSGASTFYSFVEAEGLDDDDFVHGTFDFSSEIADNIRSGRTLFGIDQQPFLQGYGGLTWLYLISLYRVVPPDPVTATGPGFITLDNIDAIPADAAGYRSAWKTPLDIAVVHHGDFGNAWWDTMNETINLAATNIGVDADIRFPTYFDPRRTRDLISLALTTTPAALAVSILDPVLFKPEIDKALAAGIPVVGFNTGRGPEADNIDYLTFIGQDDYTAGYRSGQAIARVAPNGSSAVCINHEVGHTGLDARCQGFIDAMIEAGISLVGVTGVLSIGHDTAAAKQTISDHFTIYPNLNIVFTLGLAGADAYYSYLEDKQSPPMEEVPPPPLPATVALALGIPSNGSVSADCTPNCGTLAVGTTVSVTAVPDSGYELIRWECTGSCPSGTATTVRFTVSRDTRITPVFAAPDDHGDTPAEATEIGIGSSIEGELALKSGSQDLDYFRVVVSETATLAFYTSGSVDTIGRLFSSDGVSLIAENDDIGTDLNFRITRELVPGTYYIEVRPFGSGDEGDYTLHVTTYLVASTVALTLGNPNNGSVSTDCTPNCDTLAVGTTVSVTAVPNSGYELAGWECTGSCPSGTATTVRFTVDRDTTITPVFQQQNSPAPRVNLTIQVEEGGSVEGPSGQRCDGPGTCIYNIPGGTEVGLTARASSGYLFDGWSNGRNSRNISLTPDEDTTLVASFELEKITLSLTVGANGHINGVGENGDCRASTTCVWEFLPGTRIKLDADPNSGYKGSWTRQSGESISGSYEEVTIDSLDRDTTLSVTFTSLPVCSESDITGISFRRIRQAGDLSQARIHSVQRCRDDRQL